MNIENAARTIARADTIIITAGAGMGVDSGLPDFRGNEGFWRAYPPMAKLGISFYEMADPHWFKTNPRMAWGFYGHRLNLYRNTTPHDGFHILLKWALQKNKHYFVFTSNVDGQFQKAGFDEARIEECHGSIQHLQCTQNCTTDIWPADDVTVRVDLSTCLASEPLPVCRNCGSLARPNILMFGDWSWQSDRSQAQEQRFYSYLATMKQNSHSGVIIELGAGTAVATVRHRSEMLAAHENFTLIRINPRDHTVPREHIAVPMGALAGLRELDTFFGLFD